MFYSNSCVGIFSGIIDCKLSVDRIILNIFDFLILTKELFLDLLLGFRVAHVSVNLLYFFLKYIIFFP